MANTTNKSRVLLEQCREYGDMGNDLGTLRCFIPDIFLILISVCRNILGDRRGGGAADRGYRYKRSGISPDGINAT